MRRSKEDRETGRQGDKETETAPRFARQPRARRSRMLTLRLTDVQADLLDALAQALKRDKAELVRAALDYWAQHGPDREAVLRIEATMGK